MDSFVKIYACWGSYLKKFLFDLDRHLYSPFSKMVALKPNVAISCEIYHLESIAKLHVQRKWC